MMFRISVVCVLAIVGLAAYAVYGIDDLSHSRMGQSTILLPSGAKVYLHEWIHGDGFGDVYLSENSDRCHPYNRWHDYKLPNVTTDDAGRPLLISLSGDSVVFHMDGRLSVPWLPTPAGFRAVIESYPEEGYVPIALGRAPLPAGWQRVEVASEHNTCSF